MTEPVDDARIAELVAAAEPRVEHALTAPLFSAGMVEVNVFHVAGYGALADRAAETVGAAGPAAVASAKRQLAESYGGRNPERGWIGAVMFVAVLASAFAAAAASGFRAGPADLAPLAMALAAMAVLCQVVGLAGSRLRPLNRFVVRMQIFLVIALAAAAALSFSNGLADPGGVIAACAVASLAVAAVIVGVRVRGGEATRDIDLSLERAYLGAIEDVEATARRAQADIAAALDPREAAVLVAVRTRVLSSFSTRRPELAAFDGAAPAGAAIIAAKADPDRWLPPAVARNRKG